MSAAVQTFIDEEIKTCNERIATIDSIVKTLPDDMKMGDPQHMRLALRRGDWQRYRDALQAVLRDKPRLAMYWGAELQI